MSPRSAVLGTLSGRLVGVAFDDVHLRGVEIAASRFGRTARAPVSRWGQVELEPGTVAEGIVADQDAFVAALRLLWERAGFRTRRVALGLDSRPTVLRRADLPALEPDDLARAAAFEIGDLLRYPLDEALVSTVELERVTSAPTGTALPVIGEPEPRGEVARVLTLAVEEATVVALEGAARRAGLQPVSSELVLAALVTGVGAELPADGTGLAAVIEVTSTFTDVSVHDRHGIVFGRVITAGVDVDEASLSDQLAMELAVLEGFTSGATGSDAEPDAPSTPGIATVVEGVRRTLQYFLTEVDHRPLQHLVLCGPRSRVAGLDQALAECFPAADVVRADPAVIDGGEQSDEVGPVDGAGAAYDAAACVARASAGLGRRHRRFDLVPPAIRERRADRRRLTAGVALAALVLPLLAADAVGRAADRLERGREADAAQQVVAALQGQLARYEDDQLRQARADEAALRVGRLFAQDYGPTTLVRQVAETMPEDTFVVSIRVQRATAGELPTAYTGPAPAATLNVSGVAADLDGVGRWMQEVGEVPALDGLWLTQTSFGPYDDTDRTAAVFTVDGAITGPAEPVRQFGDDR